MKKVLLIALIGALIFSLASCGVNKALDGEYSGYYLSVSRCIYDSEFDSVSITNYEESLPFGDYPEYQELVQYGYVGIENEGVIYLIYIVDTSIDPESSDPYYCAEFDGETRELLFEEGTYFSDKAEQDATVKKLLDMMDALKGEYIQR